MTEPTKNNSANMSEALPDNEPRVAISELETWEEEVYNQPHATDLARQGQGLANRIARSYSQGGFAYTMDKGHNPYRLIRDIAATAREGARAIHREEESLTPPQGRGR